MSEMIMEKLHVHVDNLHEMPTPTLAVPTVEVEPEHFDARTFTLTAPVVQSSMGGGTSRNDIVQILALDPNRKDAAISVLDAPVVLAGSYGQAADAANQIPGVPNPVGVLIPVNGSVSLTGTDSLWAVNTTPGTSCRVGVIINRRGSA